VTGQRGAIGVTSSREVTVRASVPDPGGQLPEVRAPRRPTDAFASASGPVVLTGATGVRTSTVGGATFGMKLPSRAYPRRADTTAPSD
jgi:hypothetical protein